MNKSIKTLATLEKVYNFDAEDLRHLLATGRLINDYDIMTLLGANNLQAAIDSINDYIRFYQTIYMRETTEALTKAKIITNHSKGVARKILALIPDKYKKTA